MSVDSPTFAAACRKAVAQLDEATRNLSHTCPGELNRMQALGHRLAVNYVSAAIEALGIAAEAEWSEQDEARDSRVRDLLATTDSPPWGYEQA